MSMNLFWNQDPQHALKEDMSMIIPNVMANESIFNNV